MGIVQKDAMRVSVISYVGIILGYINRVYLFLLFLTEEQIGFIGLLLSTGVLFASFTNLGTLNISWKFFPFLRNPEKKHSGFLSMIITIVLIGILFFGIVYVLLKGTFEYYFIENSKLFMDYYYWVLPTGVGIVFFKVLENYLKALFKNVFAVIARDLIPRVLVLFAIIAFAYEQISFDAFVIIFCLTQIIPAFLLIAYLIKLNEWHFSIKSITIPKRFRKIIINYSLYSYFNSLVTIMVISIDLFMVSSYLGLIYTGVYTIMLYLIRALMIPYTSMSRISSPLISEYWKEKNIGKISELYTKFSSIGLFIGLFGFLGVWINREDLFSWLADKGPEYYEGMNVFLFLMIARISDMYMGLNGIILITSKKYRYDIFFTSALLVVVIVLNQVLIPRMGISGAALATAIGIFGYNMARLIFVYINFKLHPFKKSQFAVIALFGLVLLGFEYLPIDLSNIWLNMIVRSILLVFFFCIPVYVLRLEPEINKYVKNVIKTLSAKLKKKK